MSEFNSMTVTAAAQIIEKMSTQAEFTSLAIQWGVDDRCGSGSVLTRVNVMAGIALRERPSVYTIEGLVPLDRAMIEHALTAPVHKRDEQIWTKMVAGLRLDGFEVCEEKHLTGKESLFDDPIYEIKLVLRRMLPEDVPLMGSRAAQSELIAMLVDHGFTVSKGHLDQAIAAFSRGDWAAANGQLRTLFEDCLNEIALRLKCDKSVNTRGRREYLGKLDPPFLLQDYNEWFENPQRPQYVEGLWQRLHSQGSHPGLSEQDDCTFRMQIVLITVRLFMRRFVQREKP